MEDPATDEAPVKGKGKGAANKRRPKAKPDGEQHFIASEEAEKPSIVSTIRMAGGVTLRAGNSGRRWILLTSSARQTRAHPSNEVPSMWGTALAYLDLE